MIAALRAEHAPGCVEVVRSLPEWFGYPGALEDVNAATSSQAGFVVMNDADELVGFVSVKPSYDETLEITYLAVRADHRREGIGRQLVRSVRDLALAQGAQSICLLTLGPSAESPCYAATVAFYRAVGFWRTKEVYLNAWDGAPTLVMVAAVGSLL